MSLYNKMMGTHISNHLVLSRTKVSKALSVALNGILTYSHQERFDFI